MLEIVTGFSADIVATSNIVLCVPYQREMESATHKTQQAMTQADLTSQVLVMHTAQHLKLFSEAQVVSADLDSLDSRQLHIWSCVLVQSIQS